MVKCKLLCLLLGIILQENVCGATQLFSYPNTCKQYDESDQATCSPTKKENDKCGYCCKQQDCSDGKLSPMAKTETYWNPTMPFMEPLGTCTHPVTIGTTVFIRATDLTEGKNVFRIMFMNGPSEENVVLHSWPDVDKKSFNTGHAVQSEWKNIAQNVTTLMPFPFKRGTTFLVGFVFQKEKAEIYYDGKLLYENKYPEKWLGLDKITFMKVEGLKVSMVQVLY